MVVKSLFPFFREHHIHDTLVLLTALSGDISLSLQSVHIDRQRTDRNRKPVCYLGHIPGLLNANRLYDVHVIIRNITVLRSDDGFRLHVHHMIEQFYQQFVDGAFCILCHSLTDILPGLA